MEDAPIGLGGEDRGCDKAQHGERRDDPACQRQRARAPRCRRELIFDPVAEEHRRGERKEHQCPTREPLVTYHRQVEEQVLDRSAGSEGQQQADGADEVPDAPVRSVLGAPSGHKSHNRDERQDAAVGVQLGQVVRACVSLETDRTATQEVRHHRDEQFRRGHRARSGELVGCAGALCD